MSSFSNPYVNALQSFYNSMGKKYDDHYHNFHGESAHILVDTAGPAIKEGSWVLDLATGTGNVALAAARKVGSIGRVVGIDISDAFLEQASRRATHLGVQDHVEFLQQDVMHLALPERYLGRQFDAVTCGSAIAMFADPVAVLRVVAAELLKPGGVFAVDTHGTHIPAKMFLDVAVPRGFRPPVDPKWLDDADASFRKLFEDSGYGLKALTTRDLSHGETKWDVSNTEATEKLWRIVVEDSTWVSFGFDKLAPDTIAGIRQAWIEKLAEYKNAEGFIVAGMKQYLALAVPTVK